MQHVRTVAKLTMFIVKVGPVRTGRARYEGCSGASGRPQEAPSEPGTSQGPSKDQTLTKDKPGTSHGWQRAHRKEAYEEIARTRGRVAA